MLQIALLAVDKAVSPTEAVDTLMALQSMLIGSAYAQVPILSACMYTRATPKAFFSTSYIETGHILTSRRLREAVIHAGADRRESCPAHPVQ